MERFVIPAASKSSNQCVFTTEVNQCVISEFRQRNIKYVDTGTRLTRPGEVALNLPYNEVKEVTTMTIRYMTLVFALLLSIMAPMLHANEMKETKRATVDSSDAATVDASAAFLLRWKD